MLLLLLVLLVVLLLLLLLPLLLLLLLLLDRSSFAHFIHSWPLMTLLPQTTHG